MEASDQQPHSLEDLLSDNVITKAYFTHYYFIESKT